MECLKLLDAAGFDVVNHVSTDGKSVLSYYLCADSGNIPNYGGPVEDDNIKT